MSVDAVDIIELVKICTNNWMMKKWNFIELIRGLSIIKANNYS